MNISTLCLSNIIITFVKKIIVTAAIFKITSGIVFLDILHPVFLRTY